MSNGTELVATGLMVVIVYLLWKLEDQGHKHRREIKMLESRLLKD